VSALQQFGPAPKRTMEVRLFGGPMDGRLVTVGQAVESINFGRMFTYTYAGKHGLEIAFAIGLKSRAARRANFKLVGTTGRDVRLDAILMRPQPVTNTGRVAHGRGAAKRAAKRTAGGDV